ncbi:MAG: hypothetical protein FWH53_00505 [Leptospirales bacterium]|nr:hypothetical protein [Leptospirales bacterium]
MDYKKIIVADATMVKVNGSPNQFILDTLNSEFKRFQDDVILFNNTLALRAFNFTDINPDHLQISSWGTRKTPASVTHEANLAIDVTYIDSSGVVSDMYGNKYQCNGDSMKTLCAFGFYLMTRAKKLKQYHVALSLHNRHIHVDTLDSRKGNYDNEVYKNGYNSTDGYTFASLDFHSSLSKYNINSTNVIWSMYCEEKFNELLKPDSGNSSTGLFSLLFAVLAGILLLYFAGKSRS